MHNLYAIFVKFHGIRKLFACNLVNESGNVPRCDIVPKFSDLKIAVLSTTAEMENIDSENLHFSKLSKYTE